MRITSYFTMSIFSAGIFTMLLMAFSPEIAVSQDSDASKPKPATPVRTVDTPRIDPVVDRILEKTEALKELTKDMDDNTAATSKQADKLDKAVGKLAETLKTPVKSDTVFVPDIDTCYLPGEPIFVRDSSLDGKTWWGKFFSMNKRLIDQCRLHFPKKHKHAK